MEILRNKIGNKTNVYQIKVYDEYRYAYYRRIDKDDVLLEYSTDTKRFNKLYLTFNSVKFQSACIFNHNFIKKHMDKIPKSLIYICSIWDFDGYAHHGNSNRKNISGVVYCSIMFEAEKQDKINDFKKYLNKYKK